VPAFFEKIRRKLGICKGLEPGANPGLDDAIPICPVCPVPLTVRGISLRAKRRD